MRKYLFIWAYFKDIVDDLQDEIDKHDYLFEALQNDFNQQLEIVRK